MMKKGKTRVSEERMGDDGKGRFSIFSV